MPTKICFFAITYWSTFTSVLRDRYPPTGTVYSRCIYISHQRFQVIKQSQNWRNQGFSYFLNFLNFKEGSLSGHVQIITNLDPRGPKSYGSGSGTLLCRNGTYFWWSGLQYLPRVPQPDFLIVPVLVSFSRMECSAQIWAFFQWFAKNSVGFLLVIDPRLKWTIYDNYVCAYHVNREYSSEWVKRYR
jgi:hypothetical protein